MEDLAAEELFERIEGLGELRSRRMFGAVGLYCDDFFFGLIDEGVLYFKVDDSTVERYRAHGASAFNPFEDRGAPPMNYYEVPTEILERSGLLFEWAREAVEVARRRATKKKARKKRAPRDTSKQPVGKLTNIGPKSAGWLRAAGIRTRADLERAGSLGAYVAVRDAGHPATLNLLWALEGALLDLRADRLPEVVKRNLRERLESAPAQPRRPRRV